MQLPRNEYEKHTEPMLSHINVGFGEDVTIADLARVVSDVVGFEGDIVFDTDRPDGAPQKLLDSARLNSLGWRPQVGLEEGLCLAYTSYCASEGA
jgi:GDP-L-fucose synthase